MKGERSQNEKDELLRTSKSVRILVRDGKYVDCEKLIIDAMKKYPHAPEPHNLFGMLLENMDNHLLAMKHFRVAWSLEPTYLPARHNLEVYGTFFSKGEGAFEESDCPVLEEKDTYIVEYDQSGIGHIVRRKDK